MGSKTEEYHVCFWKTYHTTISGGGKRGEAYGPTPEQSQKTASERYHASGESGGHESHSISRSSSSSHYESSSSDYDDPGYSGSSSSDSDSSPKRDYSGGSESLDDSCSRKSPQRGTAKRPGIERILPEGVSVWDVILAILSGKNSIEKIEYVDEKAKKEAEEIFDYLKNLKRNS